MSGQHPQQPHPGLPQHPQQPPPPAYQASGQQPGQPPAPAPQSQLLPPQPGQQQSGYPAGPPLPGQPGFRPPSEPHVAPAVDPQAAAELKEAQAAASIGAQVILDFNSDSGLGARGGAGGTVEENQIARDEHLVALGLDPVDCSGPPPSPEQLAARREREARQAREGETTPPPLAKATRMSSLAAGIAPDLPAPPAEGGAPRNVDVPFSTR